MRNIAVLFSLLMACSASSEVAPTAEVTPTAAVGERRLEGTLKYTPLPAAKSVEAYLGVEFTLDIGREKVVLGASDTVPRERLEAAADTRVKVVCTLRPGRVPEPYEAYPVDMDGKPMKRPDVCVVSALE